jgi:hypothetical protein
MTTTTNLTGTTATDRHGHQVDVITDNGAANVLIRLTGTNYGGWVARNTLTTN